MEELLEELKSKKKEIREKAVDELALAQDTTTVPELMKVLETDEEASVRHRVALALGRINDERCIEVLFRVMMNDTDEETRKNAAISLGKFGDERAILPLYTYYKAPRKNTFFDNLDRARINKTLNELAQKKMKPTIEELVEWHKEKVHDNKEG